MADAEPAAEYRRVLPRDHYEVLGINRKASGKDIKSAYRKAAKLAHPDVNPDRDAAAEEMRRVNEAYAVLSNSARRENYDRMLPYLDAQKAKVEADRAEAERQRRDDERKAADERQREVERQAGEEKAGRRRAEAEAAAAAARQRALEAELARQESVKRDGAKLGRGLAALLFTADGRRKVEAILEPLVRSNKGWVRSDENARAITLDQVDCIGGYFGIEKTPGGNGAIKEWRKRNKDRLRHMSLTEAIREEQLFRENLNDFLYKLKLAREYHRRGSVPTSSDWKYIGWWPNYPVSHKIYAEGFKRGWESVAARERGPEEAWFVPRPDSLG